MSFAGGRHQDDFIMVDACPWILLHHEVYDVIRDHLRC